MTISIIEAHRLAHQIEWAHAKERAALKSTGRNRVNPDNEFDALAATCLGDLIYTRSNCSTKDRKPLKGSVPR